MKILMNSILFLRNNSRDLNLSAIERIVLISIAGRIGKNNATWIKQKSLADECLISIRYLRRILVKLVSKGLLKIKSIITGKGSQNTYQLGESIINYRNSKSGGSEKTTGSVDPIPPVPCGSVDPNPCGSVDPMLIDDFQPEPIAAVAIQAVDVVVKDTILNIQEDKITNTGETDVVLPDFIDPADWQDFKVYRQKETKKPLGIIGQKRAISTLTKLYKAGQDIHEVIERSITSGWSGLFPIRGGYATGQGHSGLNARQASLKRGWDAAFNCNRSGTGTFVPTEF